jgi:hypothetical protein
MFLLKQKMLFLKLSTEYYHFMRSFQHYMKDMYYKHGYLDFNIIDLYSSHKLHQSYKIHPHSKYIILQKDHSILHIQFNIVNITKVTHLDMFHWDILQDNFVTLSPPKNSLDNFQHTGV